MASQTIVVPHSSSQDSIHIWIAALGCARAPTGRTLQLLPVGREVAVPNDAWRVVTACGKLASSHRRNYVQTLVLGGLSAGRRYGVSVDGNRAGFRALPGRLPSGTEQPLSILLASCFYLGNDKEGRAGRLARQVQGRYGVDLKFLCGDQVYLDVLGSFPSFLLPLTQAGLAERFQAKYVRTWSQEPGFRDVLGEGASCFCADDHEFWNNYPNPATAISYTWTEEGRRKWAEVARGLFDDFQAESAETAGRAKSFRIGRMSFFVADTRVFRKRGEKQLMDPVDFRALLSWIGGLDGPGVLVVGQPVFSSPSGRWGKSFLDRRLSNYEQYDELAEALMATHWSVLVLTGDVHFGRVAECELRNGAKLIEVIASPLSLVNGVVGGRAEDAPSLFPFQPGVPKLPVRTLAKSAESNFATLHIKERPRSIEVLVRYWFPRRSGFRQGTPLEVGPLQLPLA